MGQVEFGGDFDRLANVILADNFGILGRRRVEAVWLLELLASEVDLGGWLTSGSA